MLETIESSIESPGLIGIHKQLCTLDLHGKLRMCDNDYELTNTRLRLSL